MTTGGGSARAVTGPHAEVGPADALLLLSCMEQARKVWHSNGSDPPARFGKVRDVLRTVVVAGGARPMPIRTAPPVETATAFTDPIGATQAAYLLRITPRRVRQLCRREVFESARRRPSGWVIERGEVETRAAERAAAAGTV